MKCIFWLLNIVCMNFLSVTGTCDADEITKSVHQLIQEKILCNYDKDIRPVNNGNKTSVGLYFHPVFIEFLDASACMKLTTWIKFIWKDEHINWDLSLYKNVQYIEVEPYSLWVPDIMLFNWIGESTSLQNLDATFATYNGMILSSTKAILKGHCVPDYTRWPFDEQACDFVLLSKQYFGHELDFTLLTHKAISLSNFVPHPEWNLVEYSARRNITNYTKDSSEEFYTVAVTLSFTVKRHASVLIVSYVIPAFALMVLSLAAILLDPVNSQRILVIFVVVILQSLYLQYLAFKINSNGNTTPRIVRFYRDSIILSTFLFVLTVLLRCMVRWTNRPPWLQSLFNLILTNRTLQLLLLTDSDPKVAAALLESGEDEGLTLVSKAVRGQQWQMFAEIINKVALILILPLYILLFVHFII